MARKTHKEERIVQVLETVVSKIGMLITDLPKGTVQPVDCIAFTATPAVHEDHVTGWFDDSCLHPDRGKQFGCLLVERGKDGRVVRKRGARCQWQVKNRSRGAAALGKRMQDEHDDEIWK